MAYDFQSRLRHVGTRLKEMGETVTITRGGQKLTLTAFPILQNTEELMPGVAVTRLEFQDWTIDAADYDFGSGVTFPAMGDKIERANGEVYRVCPMNDDEPPYRFTTSARNRMRVHSERIIR